MALDYNNGQSYAIRWPFGQRMLLKRWPDVERQRPIIPRSEAMTFDQCSTDRRTCLLKSRVLGILHESGA